MIPEFVPFKKIPRLNRDMIVTEKIDGTNAIIYISDDGQTIQAGSRTRWIYPGKEDNAGFAGWVEAHKDELLTLGPGHHFGEWWGQKIQRGYGLTEKRFSLFHTHGIAALPLCVGVVPVLAQYSFNMALINEVLADLAENGSKAAPGFMQPEGIVVYHTASGQLFKVTIEGDEKPKTLAA